MEDSAKPRITLRDSVIFNLYGANVFKITVYANYGTVNIRERLVMANQILLKEYLNTFRCAYFFLRVIGED